jgi:hypothetical protein
VHALLPTTTPGSQPARRSNAASATFYGRPLIHRELVRTPVSGYLFTKFIYAIFQDARSMLGLGAYVAPNSSSKSFCVYVVFGDCYVVSNENLLTESYTYLRNDDPTDSPNFVILRCAVVVGKTFPAIGPMYRITSPPSGYDSVNLTYQF